MTLRQELSSWLSPTPVPIQPAPVIGSKAPSTPNSALSDLNGQPTILTFLRHCGCPFAERTFLRFRSTASAHPKIKFIAISHSSQSSTNKWVEAVGGTGPIQIIVDPMRKTYAQWGLGISSLWHVLNPWGLWNVYKLGKEENIWNRPTESGSRWQTSGSFAIDRKGIVRWGGVALRANWVPDFEEAVRAIKE
ncbi:MAG: hypothetical protein Q9214_005384 [Letrouitia sp. 1 TL-2023]